MFSPTTGERADAVHELGACGVAAHGVVRAAADEIARLRTNPGPHRGEPFPLNLLKNSDEQTVVGLAAVLQAIERFQMAPAALAEWGLVAAPRYFGRMLMAHAIEHFGRTGPPSVSPLIVPHRSLHAFSGTISLALDIRGPNLSAGGGPGALADGLQTALALVQEPDLPGVWLVMTEWDPEPAPDLRGQITRPCTCQAVALALVPPTRGRPGSRLCLQRRERGGDLSAAAIATPPLASLASFLAQSPVPGQYRQWSLPLTWGGELILTLDALLLSPPPAALPVGEGLSSLTEAQP